MEHYTRSYTLLYTEHSINRTCFCLQTSDILALALISTFSSSFACGSLYLIPITILNVNASFTVLSFPQYLSQDQSGRCSIRSYSQYRHIELAYMMRGEGNKGKRKRKD